MSFLSDIYTFSSTPRFDKGASNVFDKGSSNVFDKGASHVFDKGSSNLGAPLYLDFNLKIHEPPWW